MIGNKNQTFRNQPWFRRKEQTLKLPVETGFNQFYFSDEICSSERFKIGFRWIGAGLVNHYKRGGEEHIAMDTSVKMLAQKFLMSDISTPGITRDKMHKAFIKALQQIKEMLDDVFRDRTRVFDYIETPTRVVVEYAIDLMQSYFFVSSTNKSSDNILDMWISRIEFYSKSIADGQFEKKRTELVEYTLATDFLEAIAQHNDSKELLIGFQKSFDKVAAANKCKVFFKYEQTEKYFACSLGPYKFNIAKKAIENKRKLQ